MIFKQRPLYPREPHCTLSIGGFVGPGADPDMITNRNIRVPAWNIAQNVQSLHWLALSCLKARKIPYFLVRDF
jgi:hypothetical protein